MPHDVLEELRGPASWLASIVLGLVGAAVGWLILPPRSGSATPTCSTGGGLLSALIGVVIVLLVAGFVARRLGRRGPATA